MRAYRAAVAQLASIPFDPLGKVLAGPDFDGDALVSAEIDLAEVARGKYDFDVAGHYARPDVFRLTVNERPQAAVTIEG